MNRIPKNIKFAVLMDTFLLPLVWLSAIFIKLAYSGLPFSLGVLIGLFLGSVLRLFIVKRRFLVKMSCDGNIIVVEYLTSLLQTKEYKLLREKTSQITYKNKMNVLYNYDQVIVIDSNNIKRRFTIVDRQMEETLREQVVVIKGFKNS